MGNKIEPATRDEIDAMIAVLLVGERTKEIRAEIDKLLDLRILCHG